MHAITETDVRKLADQSSSDGVSKRAPSHSLLILSTVVLLVSFCFNAPAKAQSTSSRERIDPPGFQDRVAPQRMSEIQLPPVEELDSFSFPSDVPLRRQYLPRDEVLFEDDPLANPNVGSAGGGESEDEATARVRKATSPLGPFMRGPQGLSFRWYPGQLIREQGTDFQMNVYEVNLGYPVYRTQRGVWILTSQIEAWTFNTGARLLDSNVDFPNELWTVDLGAIYSHQFDNGWEGMTRVAIGTASDRPFHSSRDLTFFFLGSMRIPTSTGNAWRFSILSMTNSPLGQYVPIPGISYEFKASETLSGNIGVPAWIEWTPTPEQSFSIAYLPMVNLQVQYRQKINPWHTLWLGYDSTSQSWLRDARERHADQFFFFEQRVGGGWQLQLTQTLGIQATAGYAFGRRFGEGETYDDLPTNNVHIRPGPYVGIQGGILF